MLVYDKVIMLNKLCQRNLFSMFLYNLVLVFMEVLLVLRFLISTGMEYHLK